MKKLLEKRNLLISEMEEMLTACETETRSLTNGETEAYEAKEAELRALNTTIQKLETRDKGEVIMENKELETRELIENEVREMTTATHSNTVPTHLSESIIKKLEEMSNVVSEVQKVNIVGDYEVLIEKETSGKAQILGEKERLTATDLAELDSIKLSDVRVATETIVSEKLLNNAPIMAHGYIVNEVSKRVIRTLEDQIFNGTGAQKDREFEKGLISSVEAETVSSFNIDVLMGAVVGMNPVMLQGAKFYMNRQDFVTISKLKDATGQYYMTLHSVVNEAPHYMICGIKIEISDFIPVGTIVLANVGQSYLLKVNGNISVKTLVEKYSDIDCIGFITNCGFNGSVVDKQGVKVLKLQTVKSK